MSKFETRGKGDLSNTPLRRRIIPLGIEGDPLAQEKNPHRGFSLFRKKEVSQDDQTYRVVGELEQQHDIPPLDPTPITSDAQERLLSWGMTDHDVIQLREVISSLRYDLCEQKAARIAKNGGYILNSKVILPEYANYSDRLDGTCGELTFQLRHLFNKTGCLKEVNKRLSQKGEPCIQPYLISGDSETHFNNGLNDHIWLGLLPQGEERNDIVTVDPSFQRISCSDTDNYRISSTISRWENFSPSTRGNFNIGEYSEKGNSYMIDCDPSAVLGISSDRALIYRLGFVNDHERERVFPILGINCPDQEGNYVTSDSCFINSDSRFTIVTNSGYSYTEIQQQEMKSIMSHLSTLQLMG